MKNLSILGLVLIALSLSSCNKYLDEKPDIKMVIPKTLEDATLLMNDYTTLNGGYPTYGEIGTDDYYLTAERWNALVNLDQRNSYIWADEPYVDALQWQRPYRTIFISNQVLEILGKLTKDQNSDAYKRNFGAALFYRAFAFQLLTELHCSAYVEATAQAELGIPLRLDAGIDDKSVRSSLKETYQQIIADFKNAAIYLPVVEPIRGRPFKASAYAGLARAFLNMGDFQQAYLYADSCLQLHAELMDYNMLKATDAYPVPRFNVEVLFSANPASAAPMAATTALMDPELVGSYAMHDLRKGIFYRVNTNPTGTYFYKGSYDKGAALFYGITNSEVYLIKAEAACRTNKIDIALLAINTLLKTRWNKEVAYIPVTENNADRLLKIILDERRKELVFRGRRWADLKRLNLDPRFQKTLIRTVGDQIYTLPPNSAKYAYRLSETVIRLADIPQNNR